MKFPPLSAMVSGSLGFLGMAALGWHLATPPTIRPDSGSDASQITDHDRQRPMRPQRDGGLVAKQMRAIRDAGSPTERLRRTVALANSLPPTEFAAWAEGDRFDFRKGPELDVFRMIMFERWIKEDPDSLISWASRNNYGQAGRALIALAKNSPQSLIEHYRAHPNAKLELQILDDIAKSHPSLALQRLQEISDVGLLPESTRMAGALFKELAKNSPTILESALETLDPNLRREAESALSGQRLASSFQTEIRSLWDRPDGWRIFESNVSNNNELGEKLLTEIANLPENWKSGIADSPYYFVGEKNGREWYGADLEGAGFSASQATSIKQRALINLASSDPEFALRKMTEFGMDSSLKQNLLTNAIRGAKGDDVKIAGLMELVPPGEDRQFMQDQLQLSEISKSEVKSQKPAEWLDKLGDIDGAKTRPYELLNQLRGWDKAKVAELRAGFNGLTNDQQRNIGSLVAAGGEYVQIDRGFAGDAIRALVSHPPSKTETNQNRNDQVMASSDFAVNLSMSDPSAATSWISTLPDGDAKLWASKNVAANWNQYDPKAVDQWMKTLAPETRDQVSQHLKKPR